MQSAKKRSANCRTPIKAPLGALSEHATAAPDWAQAVDTGRNSKNLADFDQTVANCYANSIVSFDSLHMPSLYFGSQRFGRRAFYGANRGNFSWRFCRFPVTLAVLMNASAASPRFLFGMI